MGKIVLKEQQLRTIIKDTLMEMYDNYNYPAGADTPDAPWNQSEYEPSDEEIDEYIANETDGAAEYIANSFFDEFQKIGSVVEGYGEDPDEVDESIYENEPTQNGIKAIQEYYSNIASQGGTKSLYAKFYLSHLDDFVEKCSEDIINRRSEEDEYDGPDTMDYYDR